MASSRMSALLRRGERGRGAAGGWRWRVLECQRFYGGEIGGERQQVVGERTREELAFFAILEFVQERGAKALHRGADRLPVHDERIDRPADVLDGEIAQDLDLRRLR